MISEGSELWQSQVGPGIDESSIPVGETEALNSEMLTVQSQCQSPAPLSLSLVLDPQGCGPQPPEGSP